MIKAALAGLFALGIASMANAVEPLHLATTDFPPYMSAALPENGVLAALTRAALRQSGHEISVQFMPWARALTEVQSGKVDGLIGAWRSEEREAFMVFPDPLLESEIGFFARRNRVPKYKALPELKGLKIGTVRGYANPLPFLAARLDTEEEIDDAANLRKLDAGRIDLVLIDRSVAEYLVGERMPQSRARLQWIEPAITRTPIYTTFAKKAADYEQNLQDLNRGLQFIKQSGEFATILMQFRISS